VVHFLDGEGEFVNDVVEFLFLFETVLFEVVVELRGVEGRR
jgi:hypothetical protein